MDEFNSRMLHFYRTVRLGYAREDAPHQPDTTMFCTSCGTLNGRILKIRHHSSACEPCFVLWAFRQAEQNGNTVPARNETEFTQQSLKLFEYLFEVQQDDPAPAYEHMVAMRLAE